MNPRKTARLAAAILIAAAMAVPSSLPAFAAGLDGTSATESAIDEFVAANPGLLAAMQRDLGLSAADAKTLGAKQETPPQLKKRCVRRWAAASAAPTSTWPTASSSWV